MKLKLTNFKIIEHMFRNSEKGVYFIEYVVVYQDTKGRDHVEHFRPKNSDPHVVNAERERAYDFSYYLRKRGYNAVVI